MKRVAVIGAATLAMNLTWVAVGLGQTVVYVDLKPKMNRKLSENLGSGIDGNSLSNLPTGEQTLGGVKFKVGPGVIQLGSKEFIGWPEEADDIAVGQKASKLHFLHATCYGGGPNEEGDESFVPDGTLIGRYLVRYADGSSAAVPIIYGRDVRDWWSRKDEAPPSRGQVAWKGTNEATEGAGLIVRLYASSWTNPQPEKTIATIDYVALKDETVCAPFCLAITAERN